MNKNGYAYRERNEGGAREVTLKFRSPDRYISAKEDVTSGKLQTLLMVSYAVALWQKFGGSLRTLQLLFAPVISRAFWRFGPNFRGLD